MSFTLAPAARAALLASDVRIVVTGASGWLGTATLDLLAGALGPRFPERVRAFGSRVTMLRLRDGTIIDQQPLDRLADLHSAPTWVFHHAFLTKDRVGTITDADYVAANRALSARVLAALGPIGATGVFVPSSGAAAAGPDAPAAVRLYGALKREDEAAFAGWAEARGTGAVVARIHALVGPYMNKPGQYALAQFLRDAEAGRPIRIRADRPTYRSFVAVADLVSLALCLFAEAPAVTRFDATATPPLEMAEIARAVAEAIGVPPRIERPPLAGPAETYAGDPAAFTALCARFGIVPSPLVEAIRTAALPRVARAA